MSFEGPPPSPETPGIVTKVKEALSNLSEAVNFQAIKEKLNVMASWVSGKFKGFFGGFIGLLDQVDNWTGLNWIGDRKGGDKDEKATGQKAADAAPSAPARAADSVPARFENVCAGFQLDRNHPTNPDELLTAIKAYYDRKYRMGGDGACGVIDCSGLVVGALTQILCIARGDIGAHGFHDSMTRLRQDPSSVTRGDFVFWHEKPDNRVTHIAIVNQTLGDGKVRVTESSGGKGYHEDRVVDLTGPSPDGRFTYSFGTPICYA